MNFASLFSMLFKVNQALPVAEGLAHAILTTTATAVASTGNQKAADHIGVFADKVSKDAEIANALLGLVEELTGAFVSGLKTTVNQVAIAKTAQAEVPAEASPQPFVEQGGNS
jgi:hypothetical protein